MYNTGPTPVRWRCVIDPEQQKVLRTHTTKRRNRGAPSQDVEDEEVLGQEQTVASAVLAKQRAAHGNQALQDMAEGKNSTVDPDQKWASQAHGNQVFAEHLAGTMPRTEDLVRTPQSAGEEATERAAEATGPGSGQLTGIDPRLIAANRALQDNPHRARRKDEGGPQPAGQRHPV